jgi:hypothetical protein
MAYVGILLRFVRSPLLKVRHDSTLYTRYRISDMRLLLSHYGDCEHPEVSGGYWPSEYGESRGRRVPDCEFARMVLSNLVLVPAVGSCSELCLLAHYLLGLVVI